VDHSEASAAGWSTLVSRSLDQYDQSGQAPDLSLEFVPHAFPPLSNVLICRKQRAFVSQLWWYMIGPATGVSGSGGRRRQMPPTTC
jgi:hypothetical protein